jgi:hypothetical protein
VFIPSRSDSGRLQAYVRPERIESIPVPAVAANGNDNQVERRMKFMIFVKSNPDIEARLAAMSGSQMNELMAAMEVFNDELKKAGVIKDCDGLRPSREGMRGRFDGTSRTVVDGPFTGDLVAGYWLWELPSMEDAVAWVKRCPNPMPVPSEIEIRPI